ncbi:MAG TPA: bifunctional phosphoribosylaminoimidazolecarboxamide formyltransferase/IMP cyclohydrolase [Acidimicrobiales bacterium]|jgi:phosphoribosylaminoimidazolecarboxamide formyltransferase/IMP cyclohydrolase|nr:bifunctional phosphoribosylaminoimidazolecarboxamide formyltransferase/IMP cyclohydrolase [Acidimicrobiales bacterium]
MRALLSVWDKRGLTALARGLEGLGCELVASGGTSSALRDAGIAHVEVAQLTGSPEMLSGRVKTLHPAIHGGILADLDDPGHAADLAAQGITPIDLVVCNLYPFRQDPSISLIDVGGPTMVRAAAKNHARVGVVVDPDDYAAVLAELRAAGHLESATRARLARKAFAHTAAYDAAIVGWFDADVVREEGLPASLHLTLERAESLRYGENPHQRGARYRLEGVASFWDTARQHAGVPLSYLNLFDADAAWRLAHELHGDAGAPAAVLVKHANACGAAVAPTLAAAFRRALAGDELSAFGGVFALTGELDEAVAEEIAAGPQADVVIARGLTEGARARLVARRKTTRLLTADAPGPAARSVRTIGDTVLVQDPDEFERPPSAWAVATSRAPTEAERRDLVLAWRVCGRTTSNAIVLANEGATVGIGAGQQSRVAAAELAVQKAQDRAKGAAAASDAFFPFADGLDALVAAGVTAVVQPGGSIRDAEIVAAADAAGLAMLLTAERHFRH